MWVGRGFDTDGDGDNDFFVAGKVRPLTPAEMRGCGCLGAIVLVIGLLIAGIEYGSQAARMRADEFGYWFLLMPLVAVVGLTVWSVVVATIFGTRASIVFFPSLVLLLCVLGVRHLVNNASVRDAQQRQALEAAAAQEQQKAVEAMRDEILRKAREKAMREENQ